MKYIYLDSFAFLSPCMLASALYDMTKNKDTLEKLCANLSEPFIKTSEVKRCGMEANFLQLCYKTQKEKITKSELDAICEKLMVSEKTKEKLLKYINLLAEAKSIEPESAKFDTKSAIDSLIFSAYTFEMIFLLKTDKMYVSKFLMPSADFCTDDFSEKISNSTYILKKHGITPAITPIQAPSFSEEWAAMCAILNASPKCANTGSIIKIGYGAGEDDIESIPNILRAVYGEEGNGDILFEAESALELEIEYV